MSLNYPEVRDSCLRLAIDNVADGTSWADILALARRFERYIVNGETDPGPEQQPALPIPTK